MWVSSGGNSQYTGYTGREGGVHIPHGNIHGINTSVTLKHSVAKLYVTPYITPRIIDVKLRESYHEGYPYWGD